VRDVRRTVRQGLWMVVSFWVPVWAVGGFADGIFRGLAAQ
jgi:hypothetical protein